MTNTRLRARGAVISIGGPPHSGKSVFVLSLFNRLVRDFQKDVFLERACPDGEGRWSGETSPDHVRRIRRKQPFSEEFVVKKCKSLENLGERFRIVLVDLGGKLAPDIEEFFRRSTHCILLSHSQDQLVSWSAAARAAECEVLAAFHSRLIHDSDGRLSTTTRSTVDIATQPWSGTLVNLDRNAPSLPYEEAIQEIADALSRRFLK
jgi:CRISPR-associated protein Csx3